MSEPYDSDSLAESGAAPLMSSLSFSSELLTLKRTCPLSAAAALVGCGDSRAHSNRPSQKNPSTLLQCTVWY